MTLAFPTFQASSAPCAEPSGLKPTIPALDQDTAGSKTTGPSTPTAPPQIIHSVAGANDDVVERLEPGPKELDDVGIDEHLGAQVPLDLSFVDADGQAVKLHEIIRGVRPALLTLNYAECPMLCNLQLDGLVDGLKQMKMTAGVDYDIITVSINPNEKLARTQGFRDKYLQSYERPQGKDGWHFLTAKQAAIDLLARVVGFKYTFVPAQNEFAHTAALMVLSNDGMVSRYLYGVQFLPRDLTLALVEASEGKVGSTLDRILLYCFHYDAATGRYAPFAQNIMRLGGTLTAIVLGGILWLAWRRERLKTKVAA